MTNEERIAALEAKVTELTKTVADLEARVSRVASTANAARKRGPEPIGPMQPVRYGPARRWPTA